MHNVIRDPFFSIMSETKDSNSAALSILNLWIKVKKILCRQLSNTGYLFSALVLDIIGSSNVTPANEDEL